MTGKRRLPGRYSDNRHSWLTLFAGEFIIYRNPVDDDRPIEIDTVLTVAQLNRKPLVMSLTNMTHEELVALREFINTAIDYAEPDTIALDEWAKEQWENGDDSHTRVYRRTPQIFTREWRKPQHNPSVPGGPDSVRRVGGTGDLADQRRGSDEALPELSSGHLGTQDHPSQDQQPSSAVPVDGVPGVAGGVSGTDPGEADAPPSP